MTGYPTPKRPWSNATKVSKVKEAGYSGMSIGPDAALAKELAKQGMHVVGGSDVGSVKEAEPRMTAFRDMGAIHVNVQLCDHDTSTQEALKVARRVIEAGEKLGIKPAI
ncbi:MAG TPA: hypothetical protein DIU35_05665, partial [Candidatus Latescibacteria bacterium]|nr:hypothetical protein [Candidatus Latescibacterota bacterium]